MEATEAGPEAGSDVGSGADAGSATILVVDDDAPVLDVASRALQRSGYTVLRAGSASEALEIAREHHDDIDLLLTDVVMPGMNGRELAEAIHEEHDDIAVLFMSAYTEDEVILRGVRVAEVHFVPKPFTLDVLTGAVRTALGRD